jgi:hypothetical protein
MLTVFHLTDTPSFTRKVSYSGAHTGRKRRVNNEVVHALIPNTLNFSLRSRICQRHENDENHNGGWLALRGSQDAMVKSNTRCEGAPLVTTYSDAERKVGGDTKRLSNTGCGERQKKHWRRVTFAYELLQKALVPTPYNFRT